MNTKLAAWVAGFVDSQNRDIRKYRTCSNSVSTLPLRLCAGASPANAAVGNGTDWSVQRKADAPPSFPNQRGWLPARKHRARYRLED